MTVVTEPPREKPPPRPEEETGDPKHKQLHLPDQTPSRETSREEAPRPEEEEGDLQDTQTRLLGQTTLHGQHNTTEAAEGYQIQEIDQMNRIVGISQVLGGDSLSTGDNAVQGGANQVPIRTHVDNPQVLARREHPLDSGDSEVQGAAPQVPVHSQLVNEEHVLRLVTENRWDEVERYLVGIIDVPEPWNLHPILFLHIRRSKLLDLIEMKRFDEAESYFARHINAQFGPMTELEENSLPFASSPILITEINFCEACAASKRRDPHRQGDGGMQHVISDYFRLHIPSKIRRDEPPTSHLMWHFGIRAPTPEVNKKASFRCMACQHVFHKESIGILKNHLRGCNMMNTPHLQRLLENHCPRIREDTNGAGARPKGPSLTRSRPQARTPRQPQTENVEAHTSRTHNSATVQQQSLPTKRCAELLRKTVTQAKLIATKMGEDQHDNSWSAILETSLDNIEMYGDMLISNLGPEVSAKPSAQQGTQQAFSQAVSVAPAAHPMNPRSQLRIVEATTACAQQVDLGSQLTTSQLALVAARQPLQAGTIVHGTVANEPVLTEVNARATNNIQNGMGVPAASSPQPGTPVALSDKGPAILTEADVEADATDNNQSGWVTSSSCSDE